MGRRVARVRTQVSEPQMAQAIMQAWGDLFGTRPTKEQVSLILAQNSLETGNRKSMWNNNVGNITTDGSGNFDYFDDLTTNEQTQPGVWKKMNLKYRSYPTLEDGVKDYLKLISGKHYSQAWQHILHPDPVGFSKSLKEVGYYTANEAPYTKTLTNLYNQFSKSDSYEQARSGMIASPSSNVLALGPKPGGTFDQMIDHYIQMLSAASDMPLKKLYKKALPKNDILITITAPDYASAIEFSRVLCAALDEDLLSTSYTHTDGQQVEVECSINGPAKECYAAVKQFADAVAETFKDATKKIGGITVITNCIMNKKSSYQPISLRTADTNYRKFLLKFI